MTEQPRENDDFIMMPKVDFCFKELMADEEVRKGFLSALLDLDPEDIKETILLPTYLRQEHKDDKLGILDVKIYLNNGIIIDIEIQVAVFPSWEERSLFYLCKIYTEQIKKGDSYEKLEKCIHVGILDYIIFPEDTEYYSRFHLKEDNRERIYSDKLEIHVLELPKLEKHLYPENKLLNWAKFFRAEKKGELKKLAETDSYIEKAYNALLHMSEDEKKRIEYEEREKAIRDYNHLVYCYKKEGLEQGKSEEMERGIQVLIETCIKLSASRDYVLQTIIEQYSISKKEAENYLLKYWII